MTSRASGAPLSWALVAAQAVILAAIALTPSSVGPSVASAREVGGVLVLAGVVGILVAAAALGRALTPLPEPNGAGMTARGPYRWVRHPMYSAVLLTCVGVAVARGTLVVWLLVALLAALFWFKARREERFLAAAYPGYARYASTTGRFVPRVARRASSR